MLGVTFISGTFVLTDTLHNTFNTLFGHIYQNVDFEVRGKAAFTNNHGGGGAVRKPIPQSILTTVRHVPGVAYAEGTVSGYAQFVAPDGKAVSTGGAPTLGLSFDPNPQLSSLAPGAGHGARRPLTTSSWTSAPLRNYHFEVGDRVRILLPGPPQTFTITGMVRFGTADNLAGATLAAFDLPTAQHLFEEVGRFDAINVLAQAGGGQGEPSNTPSPRVLPPGVEVVTGQTVANEQTNAHQPGTGRSSRPPCWSSPSSRCSWAAFTIFNTFSIIVGQRTRELALLRIVGASRRQVFRSVLVEAAILGLVASLVGLGLGVLGRAGTRSAAQGLRHHAAVGTARLRGHGPSSPPSSWASG